VNGPCLACLAIVNHLSRIWAILSFAIACGGGTAQVPSGCEDVVVPREQLPQCDSATCEQAQREAQRTVRWDLSLQHDEAINEDQFASRSADVLEHQLDCVLRQLQSLGLEPERQHGAGPPEFDAISIDASFGQIESVLRTAAVNGAEASCVEADCQRCETFTESQCLADTFCRPVSGRRLDASRGCWQTSHAGCLRREVACDDAETNAISPDGACWWFSNTCLPSSFSASMGRALECSYATFETAPQCAP